MSDQARVVWALGERIKELTALHGTARVLEDPRTPPDRVLAEVAILLPPAWQYPEVTAARIAFGALAAETEDFVRTPWRQAASFSGGGKEGSIEVVYLAERPSSFEGPFLKEERALIESLARMLSSFFERRSAEEKLLAARDGLEREVHERTAQLGRLASELALAEERERRTIASDLHDHIGQALAMIKMRLAGMQGDSVFGGLEQSFEDVLTLVDQTIKSVRTLTFEISPPVLYELGLEPAVDWLCRQARKKHGLKAEMTSSGRTAALPDDARITLFRSVQELLLNAAKHARASSVRVGFDWGEDALRIEVRDDGVGFDVAREEALIIDKGAFGLFSIRERMKSREGALAIASAPGRGTSVTLTMPLDRSESAEGKSG